MGSALKYKHTQVPRQPGEQGRLKVVQGNDQGVVFVLLALKVTLGRGEENDIVLTDLKASRGHAILSGGPLGWKIKDLGSANGIVLNGKVIRDSNLKSGDRIVLGETTLEFFAEDANTRMLMSPAQAPAQSNLDIPPDQTKLRNYGLPSGTQAGAPPKKKKNLVLIVGGAIVLLFLVLGDDDKGAKKPKKKNADEMRDLAAYLPKTEKDKSAETLFKDGLREYFTGNYSRAKVQFETVLQIVPGHALANIYLENCNKALESSIKYHLEQGKKSLQAGRLRESKGHFARVMRILFKDQTNPSYMEAKDQLEKVNKEMTGEGNN